MALIQGQAGPQTLQDGSQNNIRQGKTGELATLDAHARYQEATYRNGVFYLDSDSVTLAAANATKGAMGTIKLVNGFYNPSGSGKNAVILYANVATVSGTPAGPYFWNYLTGVVVTSATTGTVKNGLLAGSSTSAMTPQVNVVVTLSGGATTAAVQLGTLGGPAAIAAGAGVYGAMEEVAGRIIVPPGTIFGITAAGAGTTHIVQSTIAWEEVAV